MNILFLINCYPPVIGGAEKLVESLSHELAIREYSSLIITRWVSGSSLISRSKWRTVYRIPCFGPKPIKSLMFRIFSSILLIVLKSKYDLIHAHSLDSPAAIASNIGPVLGKPVYITIHNTGKVKAMTRRTGGEKKLRRIIKHSRALVSINREITEELEQSGCPRDKIAFIQNGVNTRIFHPLDNEEKLHKTKSMGFAERDIFLFVGDFIHQKGIDTLLEAWSIFGKNSNTKNCILLLIGDGALGKSMRNLARELNLEPNTRFLGARNDVHRYLQIANVFIQPSRWEGLSIALLEALASETTVIATPVGGANEIITDGFNGLISPIDNPIVLASKISILNEDRELSRHMAIEGRRTVEKGYSIGKCTDNYLRLFIKGCGKGEKINLDSEDKTGHLSSIQQYQPSSKEETEKVPG